MNSRNGNLLWSCNWRAKTIEILEHKIICNPSTSKIDGIGYVWQVDQKQLMPPLVWQPLPMSSSGWEIKTLIKINSNTNFMLTYAIPFRR